VTAVVIAAGAPPGPATGASSFPQLPAAADSFPHARHATVSCLACHETGAGHGRLTFERPLGCASCHHQAPAAERCPSCHRPEKYGVPKPRTVTVAVPGHEPKARTIDFVHQRHASRSCVECHTTPVTLAPEEAKVQCKSCHTEHHAEQRTCSTCHRIAEPKAAHASPQIHQRCDACHTPSIVARLTPTRKLCATCHAQKTTGHYDQKECSACHFLAAPSVYRSKLMTQPR
jgi:hypothetical protein